MTIKKPLAAAFLMMATAAFADTRSLPSGFNAPPAVSGAHAMTYMNDAVFTCSTPSLPNIPYASCNADQLSDRLEFNGNCPPASEACRSYMQRILTAANPHEGIAAYTPPLPDQHWASEECQHFGCKLENQEPPEASAHEAGKDAAGASAPLPPQGGVPPPAAYAKADFPKAINEARQCAANPASIVDLGDNRYGRIKKDASGTVTGVTVCGQGDSCESTPRPPSQFPRLPDMMQEAASRNNGIFAINTPAGNYKAGPPKTKGFTPPETPPSNDGDMSASSNDTAPAPAPAPTAPDVPAGVPHNEARDIGGEVAAIQRNMTNNGTTPPPGADVTLALPIVKIDGATVKLDKVFTYTKAASISGMINHEAAAVSGPKSNGIFAAANAAPGDESEGETVKYRGVQASVNGPAAGSGD